MKRAWPVAAVLAAAAVLFLATLPPDGRLPVARVAIFGIGLVVAVRIIRRVAPAAPAAPDLFDLEAPPPLLPTQIAGLRRIEFDLQMATVHPFGIQWVRPLLRELASGQLRRERGIDIERDTAAARATLGEPLWGLIGQDGGQWTTDDMRVSIADLEAGVARLEQV